MCCSHFWFPLNSNHPPALFRSLPSSQASRPIIIVYKFYFSTFGKLTALIYTVLAVYTYVLSVRHGTLVWRKAVEKSLQFNSSRLSQLFAGWIFLASARRRRTGLNKWMDQKYIYILILYTYAYSNTYKKVYAVIYNHKYVCIQL